MKKVHKSFRMRTAYGVLASVTLNLLPASVSAMEVRHGYVPVVEEGKVWNCSRGDSEAVSCIFSIQGDTLIGDRSYKKVLRQDEPYYNDNDVHYYCAVREDEEARQVYIVELEQEEEELLYDFSRPTERILLSYGDVLFLRGTGFVPKASPSDRQYLYELFVPGGQAAGSGPYWFDGLGCTCNPFSYGFRISFTVFYDFIEEENLYVRTCELADGTVVFDDEWLALPTPVKDIQRDSTGSSVIYDLQGRRLQGKPQRGVYIQDGVKRVVR